MARDDAKQLRSALGRTALQLLGAAYFDMVARQDYPADPRGMLNHDAPRWCRWAQIAFENYRLGCGHDAAEIFSYARSMRPWVGEVGL